MSIETLTGILAIFTAILATATICLAASTKKMAESHRKQRYVRIAGRKCQYHH